MNGPCAASDRTIGGIKRKLAISDAKLRGEITSINGAIAYTDYSFIRWINRLERDPRDSSETTWSGRFEIDGKYRSRVRGSASRNYGFINSRAN